MVNQRLFLFHSTVGKKTVALFASNANQATLKLLALNEPPKGSASPYRCRRLWYRQLKLSEEQLYLFLSQLTGLLRAHPDMLAALEWIKEGESDLVMQAYLHEAIWRLKQGKALSEAFPWDLGIQSSAVCRAVLKWAEAKGGMFAAVLGALTQYLKLGRRLRKQHQQALYYPCAVLALSSVSAIYLISTVLPMMKEWYAEDLPKLSSCLLKLSLYSVKQYVVGIGCVLGAVWTLCRINWIRELVFTVLAYILGLVKLQKKMEALLFVKLLSVALQGETPLPDLLSEFKVLHGSLGRIARALTEHLDKGMDLLQSIRQLDILDQTLVRSLCLGIRNDTLKDTLTEVEQELVAEIEQAIQKRSALLGPLLLSVVGVLLAALLYALYAPFLKLPQQFI